ncbi:MAG: hypothetical protein A2452_00140 [Candidatus Firestonebacteria bacterium RIFOXYC2_FULL_39_67]|nr:MAG: hypothetical protein A2536_05845 [Candidatus Firestonebacteria bacterium RIFOXYD2_FULL_39_29]OGF54219.1 MAG: hypothetical protein A2452_00140 [Candidatus Firestonebacteria bacterium RIFOXYC2_FULL_39_67]
MKVVCLGNMSAFLTENSVRRAFFLICISAISLLILSKNPPKITGGCVISCVGGFLCQKR